MKRIYEYIITKEYENKTVEQFLKAKGYSNKLLVHLRKTPMGISIGQRLIYTTHRLMPGETLTITLVEEASSEHIVPTPIDLSIVYEDEDILVVNKAANVPIHPSQGNFDNTLANGLAYYFKEKDETFVNRTINRLDRDTTGLLIIARHMLSACILSKMVKHRQINRQYLAVTSGYLPEAGVISGPIARVSGSTIERCVDFEHGEAALTYYKRIAYNQKLDCTLASILLETGRTHQIRVHMRYLGYPLMGDFLYNPDYRFVKRQTLHSHKLSFLHPITMEHMVFSAPCPEDWAEIISGMVFSNPEEEEHFSADL